MEPVEQSVHWVHSVLSECDALKCVCMRVCAASFFFKGEGEKSRNVVLI